MRNFLGHEFNQRGVCIHCGAKRDDLLFSIAFWLVAIGFGLLAIVSGIMALSATSGQ
jgi:hypothetical protein